MPTSVFKCSRGNREICDVFTVDLGFQVLRNSMGDRISETGLRYLAYEMRIICLDGHIHVKMATPIN
jgi:hypothetical protein